MSVVTDLRQAVELVKEHGFGADGHADRLVLYAARDLVKLYDDLGLAGQSQHSAADQCQFLYGLLDTVGLEVP